MRLYVCRWVILCECATSKEGERGREIDTEEVTKFVGERDKEKLGCCLPAGPTDRPPVLYLHLDAKRNHKLVM